MKRIMKCLTLFVFALFVSATPVMAAEDGNSVKIHVNYSESIEPQVGDTFQIEYREVDGTELKTITIDGSKLNGKTGTVEIKPGNYFVNNLFYMGVNKNIEKEGYAMVGSFEVTEDVSGVLYLGVGLTEGNKIIDTYDDPIAIQQYRLTTRLEEPKPSSDVSTDTENPGTEVEAPDSEVEIPTETPDAHTEPLEEPTEKPDTEKEEPENEPEKKPDKKNNYLLGILPIVLFCIVGFILVKKYSETHKF